MNDNLLILLVLFFAQNKQLMEDMRPALDFLEEHKDALAFLGQLAANNKKEQTAPSEGNEERGGDGEKERAAKKEAPPSHDNPQPDGENAADGKNTAERKNPQSPLQGIANEEILRRILSFTGQNRP